MLRNVPAGILTVTWLFVIPTYKLASCCVHFGLSPSNNPLQVNYWIGISPIP
jgi:hypothetical protein